PNHAADIDRVCRLDQHHGQTREPGRCLPGVIGGDKRQRLVAAGYRILRFSADEARRSFGHDGTFFSLIETRSRTGLPCRRTMVYPRACPSCGRDEPSPEQLYSTRAALDGGTPSPWRPETPGRLLD